MEPLTQNDLKQLDTAALLLQAQAIRDAVAAKTVSARQVGELFCGLIEACDDINAAVSLFLSVNLPEILADIDKRLAGADTAAADTRAELQKSEAARARIDSLISQLSGQSLAAPLRVDIISAPRTVTLANPVRQQIRARLFPASASALSSAWATTKPSTFRPTASSPRCVSAALMSMPWLPPTHRFTKHFASMLCHRVAVSRPPARYVSTAKVI
ncbi:hypothetical protein EZ315_15245 [Duncaniella freteri]|uniref:Uncharacterized protein n=1 Tax=Duncaniella freteri TaxID=2530391 RepID=A0A4Z0V2Y2_9BACT|nr:hypothetical protein [Duncaniella freteri]TGG37144.1 hypothetical protein EZ315_15245 [Duncaniella freteri]